MMNREKYTSYSFFFAISILVILIIGSCTLHNLTGSKGGFSKGCYFEIETRSVYLKHNYFNNLGILVYLADSGQSRKIFEKDIDSAATKYIFPDHFFDSLRTRDIKIFLYPHYRNGYEIIVKPEDWLNKKVVYAIFSVG